jgi:DNA polymerase-3 subunit beta
MKFIVDKTLFISALKKVKLSIASKNSNTILSSYLLSIKNNQIAITGTDNDEAIICSLPVIADIDFDFSVEASILLSALATLSNENVEIVLNSDNILSIKSVASSFSCFKKKITASIIQIPCTDKSDFPVIPRINKKEAFEVEQSVFKDMIKNVSYAASTDVIKPSFNGVYFISEKKGFMSVVASDSCRLSICSRSFSDEVEIKEGVIIPLKTINDLLKILGNGKCFILVKNNQCFFKIDNTEIITRVIDGQFPNYKQVIPVDYVKKVYVKKDSLIDSLQRVMVFTKEPSYKVYLNFLSDKIKIEAKTAEIGEGFEEITAESNNKEDISLGINSQYLLDSIKDIDFDIIEIGITGVMSPLCIKNEKDEHTTAVIMPIQIK